ncbi:MAG TPA: helix-turn-helix domain-containing protein, partial [Polyangiaceae bacterium]|nr:helix-turn-helix domain-containing protein [Polyangiaceae bacterium]
ALTIPPLRERPADLELLIRSLLAAACRQLEREPLSISSRAFELLLAHGWPGNVRELRNAMERAAVLCADKTILPEHLPPALRSEPKPAARPIEPKRARREPNSTPPTATGTRGAGVNGAKSPERDQIIEALRQCGGNQSRAAGQLGISRRTLISRLGEYELPRPRKKD